MVRRERGRGDRTVRSPWSCWGTKPHAKPGDKASPSNSNTAPQRTPVLQLQQGQLTLLLFRLWWLNFSRLKPPTSPSGVLGKSPKRPHLICPPHPGTAWPGKATGQPSPSVLPPPVQRSPTDHSEHVITALRTGSVGLQGCPEVPLGPWGQKLVDHCPGFITLHWGHSAVCSSYL